MKHIHYIYIGALAFLIACSSEERITTDSNEKPSGPIVLSAGIVEGSSKATTRTVDGNHANHLALTTNTQLALQVSGTWIGHGSGTVVQTTTATVRAETPSESKHNALTCNPTLYWDDYGSADPANMVGEGNGRDKGLTIYGAAINGKSLENAGLEDDLLNTETNWAALSWTLPTNQSSEGSQPADKDLLISNNVKAGKDGTYLFDDSDDGKLLEFTHALSKITVVLTANNGFPGVSGNEAFEYNPQVTLTSNEAGQSINAEWAYRTGVINVTNGAVSSRQDPSAINMYQATANGHTVSFEALVMPDSEFTADNAIIARINADGNIYYVTAAKIREKITGDSKVTEAGKNYIINVTVDKTGISNVSATVTAWSDVVAAAVAPKINVTADWGSENAPLGTLLDGDYSFYRSKYVTNTSIRNGYGTLSGDIEGEHYYAGESTMTKSSSTWTMTPTLYWPDHNTHYQFRCVWPNTVITTGNGTGGDGILDNPRVIDGSGALDGYQVIKVKNVAYSSGTFPSDLMIARPEIQDAYGNLDNTITCNNSDHNSVSLYDAGICATEGNIKLSFRYMMSKVKVNLTTSKEGDQDYPATVNLNNAKVEIVNVHKTGDVKLGDREVIPTGVESATPDPANDTFGSYILDNYTYNGETKTATYSSAIVPQTFAYTSPLANGNAKFRITIYKDGNTNNIDDIYEADLQPILVQEGTSAAAAVDGWESGKSYVYNLRLTKTKVLVTASLTPWTEVRATQNIWF